MWSVGPPRCAKKAFKRLSYSWISYNVLMTRSSISKIRDFYISSLKQIKWFPVDLYLKPSKAHLILMLSPPYLIQRFMWINTLIWKFKLQGPLYTATLPQREKLSLFFAQQCFHCPVRLAVITPAINTFLKARCNFI